MASKEEIAAAADSVIAIIRMHGRCLGDPCSMPPCACARMIAVAAVEAAERMRAEKLASPMHKLGCGGGRCDCFDDIAHAQSPDRTLPAGLKIGET